MNPARMKIGESDQVPDEFKNLSTLTEVVSLWYRTNHDM